MIRRPKTRYDDGPHTYTTEGGVELLGVSTAAKIGQAEDAFGIASAWGFKLGLQGAVEVTDDGWTYETMRKHVIDAGFAPWKKRDEGGQRGSWVHDMLENLGQHGEVAPVLDLSAEVQGHAKAVFQWYVDYRPSFVALEVQVTSEAHGFAGRYDVRAMIEAERLVSLFEGYDTPEATRVRELSEFSGVGALCLIDLKTSKDVYPEQHFPQLMGYELASVEMGFPPTDAQFVLNTRPDGTYKFVPGWATCEDFLAYLEALRAIRRIKGAKPKRRR